MAESAVHSRIPGRRWWLAQAAILLLTAAFRCYRMADLPPGVHYDEAFNYLDAWRLLHTPLLHWPIFLTGNFGREPLHVYLVTGAFALFGPSVLSLRLVSAVIGVLLTPALAWLAWELAPYLGLRRDRLSLWAAAAPLMLLWLQVLSRYATRDLPLAICETLTFAALWRAWRSGQLGWWAAAGVLAGVSFYTYLPVRLLPLVLVPVGLVAVVSRRRELREQARGIALGLVMTALVAGPLALYFVRNPVSFFTRIGQVSILQQGPAAIAKSILAVLGMTLVAGDTGIRNNIPGRPALDVFTNVFFLIGLAWSIWRLRRPAYLFLLTWLAVMLMPTVLSTYAPHFPRAVGALPPLILLIAVGVERAVSWAEQRRPAWRHGFTAAAWLALAASTLITLQAFYGVWVHDKALFFARDVGFVTLGQEIKQEMHANGGAAVTYLSPRGWDHPTLQSSLLGSEPPAVLHGFNGGICVRLPTGAANYFLLAAEDERAPALLATYLPDSSLRTAVTDPYGRPWAFERSQPAGGRVSLPEMTPLPVDLGDGISLLGYWLSSPQPKPGEHLAVRLFWRARSQPSLSYTAYVHLLGTNPDGTVEHVSGADAMPGGGSCPTNDWLPGEIVVDELQLAVPADTAPGGSYSLTVGLYTLADMKRLAVPGHVNDEIILTPLVIGGGN